MSTTQLFRFSVEICIFNTSLTNEKHIASNFSFGSVHKSSEDREKIEKLLNASGTLPRARKFQLKFPQNHFYGRPISCMRKVKKSIFFLYFH